MAKEGISVMSSYPRRPEFRKPGSKPRPCVRNIFPGMTSRISGIGVTVFSARPSVPRSWLAGERASRLCPSAASTKRVNPARPTHGKARRCTCCKWPATKRPYKCGKQNTRQRCKAIQPINLRDLLGYQAPGGPCAHRMRSESTPSIRKRFVTSGHVPLGALSPEAHKTAEIVARMNKHRGQVRLWRRRRRSGPFGARGHGDKPVRPRSSRWRRVVSV